VLEGFTLQGGSGTVFQNVLCGGGVFCDSSSPTIERCVVRLNSAEQGGGVFLNASGATFSECFVQDNVAETSPGFQDGVGGGFFAVAGGNFTLVNCTVRTNTAKIAGGLWIDGSTATLADCLVQSNVALDPDIGAGGGLFADGNATCMLDRCTIEGNLVPGSFNATIPRGGGLYLGHVTAVLTDCMVLDNVTGDPSFDIPGEGGGIYTTALTNLTAVKCTFERNLGHIAGGGVYGIGSFKRCSFAQCESQYGGAVHATSAQLTLTDCVLQNNFAVSPSGSSHFGGGVFGPAVLTRCQLIDNIAFGEGGGVDGATLFDCELRNNHAASPDGQFFAGLGGGANNATLVRCRISLNVAHPANSADSEGGGARNSVLSQCEIVDNSAYFGGGVAGSILDRCTVYGNLAVISGGGLWDGSARDSIVWANVPESIRDPGGTMVVEYCDVEGGFAGTGNIAADPLFWREASRDLHLRAGSPCIDAGDPASLPDPDGSRADMGAHPFDPAYLPEPWAYCTAKTNSCGALPALSATGQSSAAATNGFALTGSGARTDNPGILLYTANGAGNAPFQGGLLCISSMGLRRGPLAIASGGTPVMCDSSFTLDMNAFASGNAGGNPAAFLLSVGQRVNVQWWGRDTIQNGSYLSDGLEYYVGP